MQRSHIERCVVVQAGSADKGGFARQGHNLPGTHPITLVTRRYHQPSAQAHM